MLTVRARACLRGGWPPPPRMCWTWPARCCSHRMALNFAARARGDSLSDLIDRTAATLTGSKAAA